VYVLIGTPDLLKDTQPQVVVRGDPADAAFAVDAQQRAVLGPGVAGRMWRGNHHAAAATGEFCCSQCRSLGLCPHATMANGVRVSPCAIAIVTRVRCDECSNALLQSRPVSTRYDRVGYWAPAYPRPKRKGLSSSAIRQMSGADILGADLNVVHSAVSPASVVGIV
jgi:hypothetical protein